MQYQLDSYPGKQPEGANGNHKLVGKSKTKVVVNVVVVVAIKVKDTEKGLLKPISI